LNSGIAFLCQSCNHLLLADIPDVLEPLLPNSLFHQRYQIVEQVGSGGFASVYKAMDTHMENRLVAIKEVNLSKLDQQTAVDATDSFYREVSFLSCLTHTNLPRIYGACRDSEHFYLIMNFIAGETLEAYQNRLLMQKTPLPLSEVLSIGIQLCAVLEYLHAQEPSIVFRDLKPANIMRTPQGRLCLIDFGIARHFKPGQTRDTIALGSLGYAAPEQYGKAQTTPLADIYSLGAVLHQLLSGNDPSEAPFRFAPLSIDSLSSLSRLGPLIAQMVEMEMNKRPTSITLIRQELQYIANIWKAAMLNFWRPGPEHTRSQVIGMNSYASGYGGLNQQKN
jgi:serine/threonine protein kinase